MTNEAKRAQSIAAAGTGRSMNTRAWQGREGESIEGDYVSAWSEDRVMEGDAQGAPPVALWSVNVFFNPSLSRRSGALESQ